MHTQTRNAGWFACLLAYAKDSRGKLIGSVVLSITSVIAGLLPYYCMFRLIAAFVDNALSTRLIWYQGGVFWFVYWLIPLYSLSYFRKSAAAGGQSVSARAVRGGGGPFYRGNQKYHGG